MDVGLVVVWWIVKFLVLLMRLFVDGVDIVSWKFSKNWLVLLAWRMKVFGIVGWC